MVQISVIKYNDSLNTRRLDADYYQEKYQRIIQASRKWPRLGEFLVRCNRGKLVSVSNQDTGYWCIKTKNIDGFFVNVKELSPICYSDFAASTNARVEQADVLLNSTGVGSIGRPAIWLHNRKAIVDNHVTILRSNAETLNPTYLYVFLLSKYGQFLIESRIRGSTGQIELYPKDIKDLPILCASEISRSNEDLVRGAFQIREKSDADFRQALSILDEALGVKPTNLNIKVRKTSYLEIKKNGRLDADYYRQKFQILDMLNSRTRNFEIASIDQISTEIKYGTSERLDYREDGVPFLRVSDINDLNSIDLEDTKKISVQESERLSSYKVKEGDILISRTGSIGNSVYIDQSLEGSIFGSYFIKVTLREDYDKLYASIFLNSVLGRLQSERMTSGTVQTNITIPAIRSIKIAMPKQDVREKACDLYSQSVRLRKNSRTLIQKARQTMEETIFINI